MRSSSKREEPENKKYVFFSDPDVIVQRAETTAAAAQVKKDLELQQQHYHNTKQIPKEKSPNLSLQFDLRGLESLLSYHPVQPYPFTFISAVKRKLALADSSDTYKKVYDPCKKEGSEPPLILKANNTQNLYQLVQKMDFIRPLKVPDLKIAPKTLDFSNRENSMSKELSIKFEAPSKEVLHERTDKPTKSFERVQRKLDFSTSDGSSITNSEIEPLKVPNISIASNLSKKKEHIRENSREKENRSKRIKKDDSLFMKQDEIAQDIFKRSKSPRHISRKEFSDNAIEPLPTTKVKNDRLSFHMPRESDFTSTKPKSKNFATSTAKKDTDKRHRSTNIRSLKSMRDNSLESKSRTCSNESLSERSAKLSDKITIRESSRNMFESCDYRYKDDLHLMKQSDESKYIFPAENRLAKQHKISSQSQGKVGNIAFKEQSKRLSEKMKPSTSKEGKIYIHNSKESEDIDTTTDSNAVLRARSPCTITMQQTKNKDSEKDMQNTNMGKSNKSTEDSKYTDDSLAQCSNTSTKKDEESLTQSMSTVTKQTSNNNEAKNLNESSVSDTLLDPRRISFRDESRSQEEFCDLVTPDMNLILRSKRKKQFTQSNVSETDARCSKHTPIKMDTEQENVPLLHPTALHMQFQAELHLLDSFNESLRQVMDVEKCLYNVRRDQEKVLPLQHSQTNNELKSHYSRMTDERNTIDSEYSSNTSKVHKHIAADKGQTDADQVDNNSKKVNKPIVKAVEVQTQTVNDIATQTDIRSTRRSIQSRYPETCGITYERSFPGDIEVPQLSLDSVEQFEDLDQIEEISLPSKLRTMSEISLHETTSSIRTETGTEISISTRDVTCSFNKYLDLEIAQLIQDEKQRYDKIEMLFKSREKTLNDRTKKLVKLEEQKRALRDTGQDSRISSVKKKQRALLLKLQQEKDEMNRLKELHKIASQERKLMLQKQRNMFNPQMSTKNILTKLKRSADSQSPRRLSGPMKGYDIRSNSSMSSLVDSDKSQHDRSQTEARLQISESDLHFAKLNLTKGDKFASFVEESNTSLSRFDKSNEAIQGDTSQEKCLYKSPKNGTKSKYEIKPRKFEEKMPRADMLRLKSHQQSVESKLIPNNPISISEQYLFEKDKSPDVSQLLQQHFNKSVSEHAKSESDTLVEELSKKSKPSEVSDSRFQSIISPRERDSLSKITATNTDIIPEELSSANQDITSKTSKSSQVSEDILQTHSKSSKKSSKSISTEKDASKKTQYSYESKSSSKRKNSKCQKSKSSSSILTENILRSKSNSQISEEFSKHHSKRTKVEKEFIHSDKNDENIVLDNMDVNDSQISLQALVRHSRAIKDNNSKLLHDILNDCESKENILCQNILDRHCRGGESPSPSREKNAHNLDNVSAKSQVSTFTVSCHSSGESEKSYTKSVVLRSQDHDVKTSKKLEQILNAREAALASRKNCVEEWMAWHAKLRAEEDRVARMEQAALKLVTTTSNVFSQQDTTVSSDTSDIEGRIELLTERLAERRIEMSRLKREARKQTKQKLRSLEANLLNQIKKYDTTIHEMRKKLETKKGITKDSDKLAIESKSLADFKVPEISLKRIQDIYKNSDLLRSRSESDLLSTKRQPKDISKTINALRNENFDDKFDINVPKKSAKGSKSIHSSEQHSVRLDTINHSIQSIFDECASEQVDCDKLGSASVSSVSDDVRSDIHIRYATKTYEDQTQSRHVSDVERISISEDIKTEMNTSKSETDISTVSEAKLSKTGTTVPSEIVDYKSSFENSSPPSRTKSISTQSEAEEAQNTENSQIPSATFQHAENSNAAVKTTSSANEILDFSKKLDFLHLNNKNLNEDISSLENELKVLSEMMSRISKKSNEELKSEIHNEEKSTSKDITEMLLKSDSHDCINNVLNIQNDKSKEIELDKKQSNSDISHYLTSSAQLKSRDNYNDNNCIVKLDNVMSVIMPEDEVSLSRSSREIDYKARSKEILNEIEKSIISEHIKTTEHDLYRTHKEDEELLDDITRKSKDKSISELYSKSIQDKENISTVDNASEAVSKYVSEQHTNADENSVNMYNLEKRQLLEQNKYISESASQTYSENSANIISKETSYANVSENAAVLKDTSEVLKSHSSHVSPNATDSIASLKHSVNLTRDVYEGKQQSINDTTYKNLHAELTEASNKSLGVHEYCENAKENESSIAEEISKDEDCLEISLAEKISFDKEDWTISDSFNVQQNVSETKWEKSENERIKSGSDDSSVFSGTRDVSQTVENVQGQDLEENLVCDIEDVSMFIPNCESTTVEPYGIKFDETIAHTRLEKSTDELDDILDIIARDNDEDKKSDENIEGVKPETFQKAIHDSATKILDKVEKSIESNSVKEKVDTRLEATKDENEVEPDPDEENESISTSSSLKSKLQEENEAIISENIETISLHIDDDKSTAEEIVAIEVQDEPVIDISLHVEIKDNENSYHEETTSRGVVITELEQGQEKDGIFSGIEVDAKIELADKEPTIVDVLPNEDPKNNEVKLETEEKQKDYLDVIQKEKTLEVITDQDSSDGEQLDNLVEVAESSLDTIEKKIGTVSPVNDSDSKSVSDKVVDVEVTEVQHANVDTKIVETTSESSTNNEIVEKLNVTFEKSASVVNKTFDVLKDPEYEDISEESLEVSEILDKSDSQKGAVSKKSSSIPEKYEAVQKSEEVLRILDEIAYKSSSDFRQNLINDQVVTKQSEKLKEEISSDSIPSSKTDDKPDIHDAVNIQEEEKRSLDILKEKSFKGEIEENQTVQKEKETDVKYSEQKASETFEQDASSESSEDRDTPKGVSEIEMDSPRTANDSRLDIEALNDDLLSGANAENQNVDPKSNFQATTIVGTSEKDIEMMIDKLKASLEQPGLEVAELEAKLLRIEQLQIELEIKKLEAEEVSYYVREIPNKPPPPYTPPGGGGRISTSLGSPSPPPAVIPSNVDELTAFTEKATALIFKAKEAGEDIMCLEAPPEIYELTKENDETAKKDRRIYNTFLFDLCKETIAEIYQAEYEKPGPSWTKPNVKTKPTMKIPKTVEELNDYVSKEVATLFGFKTKLQRENMVMRWSRKRRDRVDELLAREAQAEEDEWTKFHHDELAVKNGLTVAILDTLIMETVNVVKVAYAKKRKIMI